MHAQRDDVITAIDRDQEYIIEEGESILLRYAPCCNPLPGS